MIIWIAVNFIMSGILVRILFWDNHQSVNRIITDEEVAHERRIMDAEKAKYGRFLLFHEQQSKEYKQWLKSIEKELS